MEWLGIVETPDGRAGITLGSFGGTTSELTVVNDGNEQEDRDAGFGEGGVDNQRFFTDSHPSVFLAVAPYETTGDLGVGLFGAVGLTDQLGSYGNPSFSPDGHAIKTQYESALLGEGESSTFSQIIVNHDTARHASISVGWSAIGDSAIGVSNFNISRDLASPGSNRAISDLEVLKLQELSLQPFNTFPALRREGDGFKDSSTFVGGTAGLGQSEGQQNQSALQYSLSFGSLTLPSDRKSVNQYAI